jgi:tRNA G18 (ribose-2'-O)-methylase SpoU
MKNLQLSHEEHQVSSIKYPICFLAHNIDVPTNIGSFFRIADALGIEKIFLTGDSIIPPNSKIKKTSRSTEKYVPYEYIHSPIEVIENLKALGYTIIGLEITTDSIDLNEFKISATDKICLILGSENYGVDMELLSLSDFIVHIPMLGTNSSMNVASACSIVSYELTRQLKLKE